MTLEKRFIKTQTRGVYHKECKINITEKDSRTMSPSRFTTKKNKTTKILGEGKFTNTENQKHPPIFFSITPLFNLLALHNKLNLKSVLMECMFFSSSIFCITFIYLHLYLKSVYSSYLLLCVIYFQKGEMLFLKLNRGKLHDNTKNLM